MSDASAEDQDSRRSKAAHIWARDEHDWYVEPEWCSSRLFQVEPMAGTVVDPACGTGLIVATARAAGHEAFGLDLVSRVDTAHPAHQFCATDDFLHRAWPRGHLANINPGLRRPGAVVCNPPFRHADAFVRLALERSSGKVAMLLPATWACGAERGAWLKTTPLYRVWVLSPRPSMPPGAVLAAGEKPGGGTKDFSWFVWLKGFDGQPTLGFLGRDPPERTPT